VATCHLFPSCSQKITFFSQAIIRISLVKGWRCISLNCFSIQISQLVMINVTCDLSNATKFTKTKKLIIFVLIWKCSKTFTMLYLNNIATHKVEDTTLQLPFTIPQGHSYAFFVDWYLYVCILHIHKGLRTFNFKMIFWIH
jgi:hypothetical protein